MRLPKPRISKYEIPDDVARLLRHGVLAVCALVAIYFAVTSFSFHIRSGVTFVDTSPWIFKDDQQGLEARRGEDDKILLRHTLSNAAYAVNAQKETYDAFNTMTDDRWDKAYSEVAKCHDPGWDFVPHEDVLRYDSAGLFANMYVPVRTAARNVVAIQQSPSQKQIAVLTSAGWYSLAVLSGGGAYKLQFWNSAIKRFDDRIFDIPRLSKDSVSLCWMPDEKAILVYDKAHLFVVVL